MNKKTILFYPASIQSHVIPAMNLASHLKDAYEIYVLVSDQKLADIVSAQGFHPVMISSFKAAIGHEAGYLKETGQNCSLWNISRTMLRKLQIFLLRLKSNVPRAYTCSERTANNILI